MVWAAMRSASCGMGSNCITSMPGALAPHAWTSEYFKAKYGDGATRRPCAAWIRHHPWRRCVAGGTEQAFGKLPLPT